MITIEAATEATLVNGEWGVKEHGRGVVVCGESGFGVGDATSSSIMFVVWQGSVSCCKISLGPCVSIVSSGG